MNRRKFLKASSGAAIGCSIVSSSVMDGRALASPRMIKREGVALNRPASADSVSSDPIHEQAVKRYSDWKFGMFIHWGQYSVASGEASWPIMKPSSEFPITQEAYVSLHERFNPA